MEIVQPFHAAFFTADCPQGEKAFPDVQLEHPSPGHGITEVGRHLWRSPNPTPCSKHGQLEQFDQDHVHFGFEHLQGRIFKFHKFSGQPIAMFDHPHSYV